MLSLRTISLYAAIACATISSAIPLDPVPVGNDGASAPGLDVVKNIPILGQLAGGVTGSTSGDSPLGSFPLPGVKRENAVEQITSALKSVTPRGDYQSIPAIFSTATGCIEPIVVKISTAVAAKVEINVVVELLNEIVVVLQVALSSLKVLVEAKLSADVLLTFKGVVLVVAEVALIVYGLLKIVLDVLYAVVVVVGITNAAVYAVVCTIGGLLVEILTVTFTLVAGLQVAVVAIAEPLVAVIVYLKLDVLLALVTQVKA